MERHLYIFKEPLTTKQEEMLVLNVSATGLKRETDPPYDLLPSIISLLRDDVDPFSITTYSIFPKTEASLLEIHEWRPLYRLRFDDDLIAFIKTSSSLINGLEQVSFRIQELDKSLRSYAFQFNQFIGTDAQSFSSLGEIISADLVIEERSRLAELIRSQLAIFAA